MSLLDDLRAEGAKIDASLLPTVNELPAIVGALIYHEEHGDDFGKAVDEGPQAVSNLLTGQEPEQVNPQGGPVPAPAPVAPTAGASTDPVAPQVSTPDPQGGSPAAVPAAPAGPSAPDAPVPNVVADAPAPSASPAPAGSAAPSDPDEKAELDAASTSDLEAQLADIQARLSARRATAQQTTVDHEPGSGA